ncbi:MAG: PAS domain S-box protein [Victivallaceae bacterium]|jgi:PAS domain S-box-containing protein
MPAEKTKPENCVNLFNKFEELISRLPRSSGLKKEFRDLMNKFNENSAAFDETRQKLLREISERKAAELFMRSSAQKHEAVFNAVYDGLIISNTDEKNQGWGSIMEANPAALNLFEYSMAEMRHLAVTSIFAAGFDAIQVNTRLMKSQEAIYEAEIISQSGQAILCELRSKPFLFGDKHYVVTVLRDIREQRASEQELRERSTELRNAQSIAKLSSWHHDLITGEFKHSELVMKILGIDEKKGETLSLNTFFNALHPEDRKKVLNIHKYVDSNNEFSLDFRIMRLRGGLSYIHCSGKVFFNNKGKPVKIVGINQDVTEKRLVEENLRQSEQNLRSILEAISVGQWEYEPVARRFTISESLALFYGYSRAETVFNEQEVFENIHFEDRTRVRNELYKLFSGTSACLNTSFRSKRRNDEFVWVLCRAVLIRDISGEPVRVVGCVEDLTESMRFDKMKEQLELLERMINSIPIPIFYKDMDGRYIGHNIAFKTFAEKHISCPLIGQTVFDVFQARNNMKVAQILDQREKKLILNGGSQSTTIKFVGANNEERLLIEHKSVLTGYGNKPQYVIGVVSDITDIKKAEVTLRKITQRLNMTFNAMQEIIMCFDVNLNLQWGNRTARNTFAAGGRKFIGRKWQEIWFGDMTSPKNDSYIKKAFKGNGKTDKRIVNAANGKTYEVWTYPVKDRSGKINLVAEAAINITERIEAENKAKLHQQQLIQADKMKSLGVLVAGVAHEISNPNNFIGINISVLNKIWRDFKPALNQEINKNKKQSFGGIPAAKIEYSIQTLLDGIKEGSERIMTIVDNLKGYVKETPPDRTELFSVNDALARSIFLLNNLLKKSTGKFSLNRDANIPQVNGVPQRLEQVIINILQNACQSLASPDRGIKVSTYFVKKSNEVVIEIKDEGCGIEKEDLKHIMDPFFTTRRDSGGTGLGLSISSSIMEEHKGRLEIKSRKGAGTAVKIALPAAAVTQPE